MTSPRIQVHHRVRIAREAAHLTQRGLAEAIGTNAHKVSNWEFGRGQPNDYELTWIAKTCGVELNWLVDGGQPTIEFRDICPVCKQDIPLVGRERRFALHYDKAGGDCPMGTREAA